MNPEEEVKKLNRVIKQYETVLLSTTDPAQKQRVARELEKLKDYRDKILSVNVINERALEDEEPGGGVLDDFPFLNDLRSKSEERILNDREVDDIYLYMRFFESDFLPFLSETKLKLDFKYSLERDSFYHKFQELLRRLTDLVSEIERFGSGKFRADIEEEMRKRIFKMKRNLSIELDRFFKNVNRFSTDLLEDLAGDALKCLNGDDTISFDVIEGKRYLEGSTVREALEKLKQFSYEVIDYLDIPEIKLKE